MRAHNHDCAKNTVRPTPPSICISIWLNQIIKYIDTAKHDININFSLAIAWQKYNGEALTMLLKWTYPAHNADHGRNATIIHRIIQPFHTPGNPRMYTNRSAIGPHYQNWDPLGVEHVHEVAINIFTIDSNNSTYTWATGVPHNKKSTQNSQAHVHRPNMAMHKKTKLCKALLVATQTGKKPVKPRSPIININVQNQQARRDRDHVILKKHYLKKTLLTAANKYGNKYACIKHANTTKTKTYVRHKPKQPWTPIDNKTKLTPTGAMKVMHKPVQCNA